jgi:Holliday junction resolvasome RuvABC DNA-binding subunit
LLLELKSRLDVPLDEASAGSSSSPAGGVHGDVREALSSLGYGADEVAAVVGSLNDSELDAEAMLREALQQLAVR